ESPLLGALDCGRMDTRHKKPQIVEVLVTKIGLCIARDAVFVDCAGEEATFFHDVKPAGGVALIGDYRAALEGILARNGRYRVDRAFGQVGKDGQFGQKLALLTHASILTCPRTGD